jgi:hypothetical protein
MVALVSKAVSTNSHKCEGIGNDRLVRVRNAGTHHFAPKRNGLVTNSQPRKPANLLAFVGAGPVMVC